MKNEAKTRQVGSPLLDKQASHSDDDKTSLRGYAENETSEEHETLMWSILST